MNILSIYKLHFIILNLKMFNKYLNGLGIRLKRNLQTIHQKFLLHKRNLLRTKLNFLKRLNAPRIPNERINLSKYFPFAICTGLFLLNSKNTKENESKQNKLFNFFNFPSIHCYKINNRELEKMMSLLENSIKNLEFRYQGKLRRQPIK